MRPFTPTGNFAVLLRDLTIENYRSFEHYKLDGLARVNLLVGDNNCGKTSVLEAGFLLTSSDPLDAILTITGLRGESCRLDQQPPNQQILTIPAVDGLFFGRSIAPASNFAIKGSIDDSGVRQDASFEVMIEDWRALDLNVDQPSVPAKAPWRLNVSWRYGRVGRSRRIWMASYGGIFANLWSGADGSSWGSNPLQPIRLSSEFVSLAGWDGKELARRWDAVLESGEKSVVVDRLRVLHSNIRDINFLPSMIGLSQRFGGIMIELQGEKKPIPLTSLGDGSQRLLVMATALHATSNGALFIDEIDTGLHYSKLPDMWRMVIKAAAELDVQVFATSHSLDCIRGLAEAVESDPDMTDQAAIFRIDRRMNEAVKFDGKEMAIVVSHEIEVR
jgi:hypothetical protein